MSFAGFKKQINKANQYVSEKVGGAEKTQIPDDYLEMERQIDATALAVEEIVSKTNEFLQPNPVNRAKLSTARTMNKMRGQTITNKYPQMEGQLGDCFLKHSMELGESSLFGRALKDCGDSMKQMADIKDSLDNNVSQNFIEPLDHLRNKELKEINHHRKKMESRRLDYDGKKRKQTKGGSNITEEEIAFAAEKFEESRELAEDGMRNLLESDVEQVRQLQALIEAQLEFHRQSADILEALQETLDDRITEAESRPKTERRAKTTPMFETASKNGGSLSDLTDNSSSISFTPVPAAPESSGSSGYRRVKALYDFEPENEGELEFNEGDIIMCTTEIDENWLEGEINGRSGYFPTNYVDFLD